MVKDVVLVLLEPSLILWGSFCALQLAKREAGQVFVLLDLDEELSPEVSKTLAQVRSKASSEGIELKIYLTDEKDLDSSLLDLLERKKTPQILVAANDREEAKDIETWLKKIEEKLKKDPNWPYSKLQYLIFPKPQDSKAKEYVNHYFQE